MIDLGDTDPKVETVTNGHPRMVSAIDVEFTTMRKELRWIRRILAAVFAAALASLGLAAGAIYTAGKNDGRTATKIEQLEIERANHNRQHEAFDAWLRSVWKISPTPGNGGSP